MNVVTLFDTEIATKIFDYKCIYMYIHLYICIHIFIHLYMWLIFMYLIIELNYLILTVSWNKCKLGQ